MCGRFIVSYTYDELVDFLHKNYQIEGLDLDYNPSYNIAPGQPLLTVIKVKDKYKVGYINWGLIPPYAKDESYKYKMINARSETVNERVSFKDAFLSRRCIILSNGYYEWKNKVPYLFEREDKKMFGFAGLWSVNKIIYDRPIYSTTIVTKEADDLMSDIHLRMPVILDIEASLEWLRDSLQAEDLFSLIEESNHFGFHKYEVSSFVNNAKNNTIKCIEPVSTLLDL